LRTLYLIGLAGVFLLSLGVGIQGIKKEKPIERVGTILSFLGSACFLVVILAAMLGKW
jgi:Ni/Fe-hydrogenase subunit HybB-like protein